MLEVYVKDKTWHGCYLNVQSSAVNVLPFNRFTIVVCLQSFYQDTSTRQQRLALIRRLFKQLHVFAIDGYWEMLTSSHQYKLIVMTLCLDGCLKMLRFSHQYKLLEMTLCLDGCWQMLTFSLQYKLLEMTLCLDGCWQMLTFSHQYKLLEMTLCLDGCWQI